MFVSGAFLESKYIASGFVCIVKHIISRASPSNCGQEIYKDVCPRNLEQLYSRADWLHKICPWFSKDVLLLWL